ncbi:MAG: DNA/RNA helicase domain-containing protein, partial [bacterium]
MLTDELPSQFRCAGSDGYLAWLDDLLGIRPTTNAELDREAFDFRLFHDPVSLHAAIRQANGTNRARLVAGSCWNWVARRNPALNDIVIPEHGYAARWNLAAEGNTWIISPTGVEEVGCIHTCQGLEVDTIGVIIGPDLVLRDGQLRVDPTARARSDKSLSGWRQAMA